MYDLITVGNISIDMYFKGETLTHDSERFNLVIGGKYVADYFCEELGGGATNVAIGVQKMGLKTAIIAKIGETRFKPLIVDLLKKHGVSTHACQFHDSYIKISTILLSPNGERTIINYETPHEHIINGPSDLLKFENTKVLYMSNLPYVPLDERRRILSHAHAKGAVTIVNLGSKDCKRTLQQVVSLLHNADIIILNAHEFADLIKHSYDKVNLKSNVLKYIPEFVDKHIIITDGSHGSYAYHQGTIIHQPAIHTDKIVDTTGAGDGFTAGFIAEYIKTSKVDTALKAGAEYAVKIIQKVGAN